jgi:hypothetical protein
VEFDQGITYVRNLRIGRRKEIFITIRNILERFSETCQSKKKSVFGLRRSGIGFEHFELLIQPKSSGDAKDVGKLLNEIVGGKLRSGGCRLKKSEGECWEFDQPQANSKGFKMHTFSVDAADGFDGKPEKAMSI